MALLRYADDKKLVDLVSEAVKQSMNALAIQMRDEFIARLMAAVPKIEAEVARSMYSQKVEIRVFVDGKEKQQERE